MANHKMRYKGSRGSEFRTYIGKFWYTCGKFGYAEQWYTQLNSYIITVKHTKSNKTIKRCWLG